MGSFFISIDLGQRGVFSLFMVFHYWSILWSYLGEFVERLESIVSSSWFVKCFSSSLYIGGSLILHPCIFSHSC